MNMFRAFMELDKINAPLHEGLSRQEIIYKLKALGRNYQFGKYSDGQLYRILQHVLKAEQENSTAIPEYPVTRTEYTTCDSCGRRLSDGGYCPVCDDGEEDYGDEPAII